jgi:hypothetical protein
MRAYGGEREATARERARRRYGRDLAQLVRKSGRLAASASEPARQGRCRAPSGFKLGGAMSGRQADESMSAPAELGALPELDEGSVLRVLRERAHAGEPYTGAAGCLVAVNPCEPRPQLYGASVQALHSGESTAGSNTAPHVFAVAAHAYGALSRGEAAHHVSSGRRHERSSRS